MEKGQAILLLLIMGLASIIVSFIAPREEYLLQTITLGLGVNWLIAGLAYVFMTSGVSEVGFLLALLFGIIGAILWLIIASSDNSSKYQTIKSEKKYECYSCVYFGKPGCKRQEKYLNSVPCEDYKETPFR